MRTLLVAALLYVTLRALVLASNFDAVAVPVYELHGKGNLAKAVSVGGGVPWSTYYDNCGGVYLTGLLAAPLYGLLGDSYRTLKLVPAGLGLLTLVLAWLLLARHVGSRAAAVAALLFAVGPPTLTKFSLVAMGNHFESLPVQLGVLLAAYEVHRRQRKGPLLLLTGLLAGFSVFSYFGSLTLLLLLAGMHVLVRGPRVALLDLRWALPGVLLGLVPLAWVEIDSGGRVSNFLAAHAGTGGGDSWSSFGQRLLHFFREILPRASVYEDLGPLSGRVADLLFLTLFVLAWLVVAPRSARGIAAAFSRRGGGATGREGETARFAALRELPLVGYLPLLAVLYARSDFRFTRFEERVEVSGYRYLIPHLLFACLLIAVAVQRLHEGGGVRRRLGACLAALALLSGTFTLPLVDWSFRARDVGSRYEGHVFERYPALYVRAAERDERGRLALDRPALLAGLATLPQPLQRRAWQGLGFLELWNEAQGGAVLRPRELLAHYGTDVQREVARGLGVGLRSLLTSGREEDFVRASAALDALPPDEPASFVVEGLSLDHRSPLASHTVGLLASSEWLGASVPLRHARAWWRGMGLAAGRLLRRGIASDGEAVAASQRRLGLRMGATTPPVVRIRPLPALDEEARSAYWFGLGWGWIDRADGEDREARSELLSAVPEEQHAAALAGLAAALSHVRD